MGNLVWLASYPFSGNRWIRGFLYCVLRQAETPPSLQDLRKLSLSDTDPTPYEQLSGRRFQQLQPQEVHNLRPQVQEKMTEAHPNPVLVETSSANGAIGDVPIFSTDYTAASIYVVRNPYAVVRELAQASGIGTEKAVQAIGNQNFFPAFAQHALPSFCGSWSDHVRSWAKPPWEAHLVLRYEDLQDTPVESFGRLLALLNLKAEPERIERAAELSRPQDSAAPLADLSEQSKQQIVASHEEAMRSFGYLQ